MDEGRSWLDVGGVSDVVIDVSGDLDVEHASLVVECVRQVLADPLTSTITVDVGLAAFVDEAAVDGLLRAKRLSLERSVPFHVRSVSARGRQLLQLLQLEHDLLDDGA